MLDVAMMPKKNKLNWFIIGLQSWAQADVERSNPQILEQTYVAAERLADTQRRSYIDTFKSTKESDHDGKREERRDNKSESSPQKSSNRKPLFRKALYACLPKMGETHRIEQCCEGYRRRD
uniref:Uncharacterized protein n=1 Tax=Nymphaea colorata TaxID=210225 RepID=A0A5K1EPG5_9MAGN|nr:unnamed protein product [Nymphaea colorata]